jgi:hypothetical protein
MVVSATAHRKQEMPKSSRREPTWSPSLRPTNKQRWMAGGAMQVAKHVLGEACATRKRSV